MHNAAGSSGGIFLRDGIVAVMKKQEAACSTLR
jgi:hypothetical protein